MNDRPFFVTGCLLGWMLLALSANGQIFKIPSPDSLAGNYFGSSVDIDQETIVIGSSGVSSCGPNSGAAYVYERQDNNTWKLAATLQPKDCQPEHFFGKTVAIQNNRILVSAFRASFNQRDSNGVYIFEKEDGQWVEKKRLIDPDKGEYGAFGSSIALSDRRILVTAAGNNPSLSSARGAGYVYELDESKGWVLASTLTSDAPRFNGVFGTSCDIQGNRIVIASSASSPGGTGRATIFDFTEEKGSWEAVGSISSIASFFMPLDLDGDRILVGESKAGKSESGRARLFELQESKWVETTVFQPQIPYAFGAFGSLVALKKDTVLIVGFDEQLERDRNVDRVLYVFQKGPEKWTQKSILDVGSPFFGSAIAVFGDRALVGQSSENSLGAAYVVQIN